MRVALKPLLAGSPKVVRFGNNAKPYFVSKKIFMPNAASDNIVKGKK